jgi:signal transduction histidine kinase
VRTRVGQAAGLPIVTLAVRTEADLVLVRQRARLIAELLGFRFVDQTRIATAVSEIARNALRHGGGGRVRLLLSGSPQVLEIQVEDSGSGFTSGPAPPEPDAGSGGAGILLARRLMDGFEVSDTPGGGALVVMTRRLPHQAPPRGPEEVAALVDELLRRPPESLLEELQQQHQELLALLEDLTAQQERLRAANVELEETNQGVMALYADVARELDETNRGVLALYAQLDDQTAELRQVNALKDRFLSHLSHEFRTPLNATLALSRLLLDRVDGPLNDEQEVQVRFIQGGAAELLEMVNDLLDLAKIEAGRMERRTERVELGELLAGLRGLFRPLAASAHLELRVADPPPDLGVVWTDEGMLLQILRNLLSNAIKYTRQGEVQLRTTRVGDDLVFAVSDTGVGIAPEELDRIFEDFVQARAGRPAGAPGTGLGLSLSRQMADLLGGSLDAESRLGAGSTFRLRLPVGQPADADAMEAAGAPDAGAAPAAAPPRRRILSAGDVALRRLERSGGDGEAEPGAPVVLVIDDDPAARYLVAHTLAPSGCVVVQAETARDGLDQARRLRPAAVFLDLGLPDRSGFELLQELKLDSAVGDVPVIVYTSRELDEREARALSGFALHVVRKSDPALALSIAGIGDALVRAVARRPAGDP